MTEPSMPRRSPLLRILLWIAGLAFVISVINRLGEGVETDLASAKMSAIIENDQLVIAGNLESREEQTLTPGEMKAWFPILRAAAERGDVYAQWRLGAMYLTGNGAPQDENTGIRWLEKADENDIPWASFVLGWAYSHPSRFRMLDRQRALYYFRRAAAGGPSSFRLHLIDFLLHESGNPPRYEEAWRQLLPMAVDGVAGTSTRLGELYAVGLGVRQNVRTARYWFSQAVCAHGADAEYAANRLKQLEP